MSTRWLGWEWVVETPAMCYFLLSLAVFAHQFVVILKFTNTVFAFYVNGMEAHNLKQKQKKMNLWQESLRRVRQCQTNNVKSFFLSSATTLHGSLLWKSSQIA